MQPCSRQLAARSTNWLPGQADRMEGRRVYLSVHPTARAKQQLTARIVQDAAMQRAMTSGGCGMAAWPYLPCSPHAADLEPRRAGISLFWCLFRQQSQGHSSVQKAVGPCMCFVLVALHMCGSAGFEFRIATHVPAPRSISLVHSSRHCRATDRVYLSVFIRGGQHTRHGE